MMQELRRVLYDEPSSETKSVKPENKEQQQQQEKEKVSSTSSA
jgi:hypothetical protein